MPIYEYVCRECENKFEALVRSVTVPECPNCQSTELEKKLSVFATIASAVESMPAAAWSMRVLRLWAQCLWIELRH